MIDPWGTAAQTGPMSPYLGWEWASQQRGMLPSRTASALENYNVEQAKRARKNYLRPKNQGFASRWAGRAQRTGQAFKNYGQSAAHQTGKKWLKDAFGTKLGLAFGAVSAYHGYQREGIWGAAKGVATYGAESYAFGAATKMLPALASPALYAGIAATPFAALAGISAAGSFGNESLGQMLTRPFVNANMRKHAKLEMTTPVRDQFGTIATMRKRSLMAMRQSKLNARYALGNEAISTYRPY